MKLHGIVMMSSMPCILLNQGIFCTLTTLTVQIIASQPILSQYSETKIILMAAERNMTHSSPILSFEVPSQNQKCHYWLAFMLLVVVSSAFQKSSFNQFDTDKNHVVEAQGSMDGINQLNQHFLEAHWHFRCSTSHWEPNWMFTKK